MFCETCDTRHTCKKPCKKLEAHLRSEGIFGKDYIRPKLPRSIVKKLKNQGETQNLKWREIPFTALEKPTKNGTSMDYDT